MCFDIYAQKRQEASKKQRKKGTEFLTLSKMNNQKAHTEADKERGGQLIGKMSPPSYN